PFPWTSSRIRSWASSGDTSDISRRRRRCCVATRASCSSTRPTSSRASATERMQADLTVEPEPALGALKDDERRNIPALLAGASLELSSRDPAEIDACADLLEPGTAVYISM